jgi:hypothetical protein
MKLRVLLTVIVFAFFAMTANSQVSFTENFDYPAGDTIGSHGWIGFSGSVNNIKVVSPGLTFPGYRLSGIGNAARLSNNGLDNYKNFTGDSSSSGSVYVSLMVKVDSAKTGDYFLALLPLSSTTLYTPRLFVKDSSGTLSFGISKGATTSVPAQYSANGYAYGTTYLLVVKYTFNSTSTTDDQVSLFVFDSSLPATEPSTPTVGPITASTPDANSIGRVALRQGAAASAPTLNVDGISVGLSWSATLLAIKPVETIANSFYLSQNYPNPFNPTTNIKFSIPSNGTVTLKVYNMLGNEVSTLVNGNMNTGVYAVDFNAANLSSGTYIYKINFVGANGKSFSDVKKLTLIK